MATIAELANKGACGAGSVLGTNSKKGCSKQLTSARALWLFAPGKGFASSDTLSLSTVQTLQAKGELIVLQGVKTFEENGDDNNIETLDDTTKRVTNEGKYAYRCDFTNGLDFNAALHSLKGYGNWNVAVVTANRQIYGAKLNSSGGFSGFDTGMLQPEKLRPGTTQEGQREGLMWQFLDPDEVNSEFVLIEGKELDFNPLSVEGINEVVLSYVNTPSDTDTTITVKATLKDMKTAVSGGTYSDFLRKVDGVTSNPTAGDDSSTAGTYVLTVSAVSTGDVETIELYDNANNRDVITLDGDLYQSKTATATAVA